MAVSPGGPIHFLSISFSSFAARAARWAVIALFAVGGAGSLPDSPSARADDTAVKGVAVLIPGTFNLDLGAVLLRLGASPKTREEAERLNPFFSSEIVQTLAAQGLAVEVVRSVAPFAGLRRNGEAALREIRDWYQSRYPDGKVPITLVGHGAGGFFALYVASHSPELPIRQVITVSTPMNGLQLADKVFDSGSVGRELKDILDHCDGWIDLRGLPALTSPEVARFLGQIRLRPGTEILHVAGSQPIPGAFHLTDSAYLSPFLALTARLIDGESDGLVTVRSAYGGKTPILDTRGGRVREIARKDLFMPLDHAKQVLDYRLFTTLDETDTELIEFLQRQAYAALGSAIVSSPRREGSRL